EDEEEDADFWILFPEPLTNGETYLLTIKYTGKDVIEDVGGGNYHVGRRTSWYPNFGLFRDRSFYKVIYSVPKKLTLISTGTLTKKWEDSDVSYSEWESEIPFTVFGFNYGRFEKVTEKDTLIEVTCYTNPGLHYRLQELRFSLEKSSELREELMMFPSELTTTKMTQNAVTQGMNVYNFFTHYFGEIPFKKISITQQPAGGYAQSWPTLIYLPYTAFLTPSVRDRLGFHSDFEILSYHEIAHQWWGHIVGFETYHDRWLDEGLAEYSAALYLQHSEGDKIFIKYMDILRKRILKKVKGGIRWTEVGPIWMGMRLRTIDNPENDYLIYSKGAYVFHMLRMMLYDFQNQSDEKFITMVKDYLNTHFNRNATTKSFQSIVEKHFGQEMDWFFDQWVYGTEVPTYKFTHTVQSTEDGKYLLTLEVTQEGVSPSFKMPLPFLVNFENGYNIITVPMEGRDTVKHEVKVPLKPKSILPNPWNAVLAEIK
ncbi:hypothetical protein IIA15_09725, partial [candidate division TA06 bacterium]|nr:hypothetical protein [candidate division TA06 bacterium]